MKPTADKFAEALEALDHAEFEEAIEILSEVVIESPERAEAWAHLGVCYLETGEGTRALEALLRATTCDPASAQNQYLLGVARGASGDVDAALACFHRALELDPAHPKAEEFRVRTESLVDSRQHFKDALLLLEKKPTPDFAARALRELLLSVFIYEGSPARDELAHSVRELQKSLRDVYCDVDAGYTFEPFFAACENAYTAARFLNWDSARQFFEQAAGMREDLFVLHGLAFASFNAGDRDTAIRIWRHVLEQDPEFDLGTLGRPRRPAGAKPNGGSSPSSAGPQFVN